MAGYWYPQGDNPKKEFARLRELLKTAKELDKKQKSLKDLNAVHNNIFGANIWVWRHTGAKGSGTSKTSRKVGPLGHWVKLVAKPLS